MTNDRDADEVKRRTIAWGYGETAALYCDEHGFLAAVEADMAELVGGRCMICGGDIEVVPRE